MLSQVFAEHPEIIPKYKNEFNPYLPRVYIYAGVGFQKLLANLMKTASVQIIVLEENNTDEFLEKVGAQRKIGPDGDYHINECGDLVGN